MYNTYCHIYRGLKEYSICIKDLGSKDITKNIGDAKADISNLNKAFNHLRCINTQLARLTSRIKNREINWT